MFLLHLSFDRTQTVSSEIYFLNFHSVPTVRFLSVQLANNILLCNENPKLQTQS